MQGALHEVIPDRVETGTFMVAAAITGGDVNAELLDQADFSPPTNARLTERIADVARRYLRLVDSR